MPTLKVNNYTAAALKADRERDKIQAMRDYEAETLARQANMMRLRALRLAKESAAAEETQETTAPRQAKKRKVIRAAALTQARGRLRISS